MKARAEEKKEQHLTAEQARKYFEMGGNVCPVCGSAQIDGDSWEVEAGAAYQQIRCLECVERWADGYLLNSIFYHEQHIERDEVTEPPPLKIVVTVSSGMVQSVWAPTGQQAIEVEILDLGTKDDEEEDVSARLEEIAKTMAAIY